MERLEYEQNINHARRRELRRRRQKAVAPIPIQLSIEETYRFMLDREDDQFL